MRKREFDGTRPNVLDFPGQFLEWIFALFFGGIRPGLCQRSWSQAGQYFATREEFPVFCVKCDS